MLQSAAAFLMVVAQDYVSYCGNASLIVYRDDDDDDDNDF